MGRKAHGRRREGRVIRKRRRAIRRYIEGFRAIVTALRGPVPGMDTWAAAVAGLGEAMRAPMNNHPSDGGQAATETLSGSGRIEAAAAEVGVELLPWQIRVGKGILAGTRSSMPESVT